MVEGNRQIMTDVELLCCFVSCIFCRVVRGMWCYISRCFTRCQAIHSCHSTDADEGMRYRDSCIHGFVGTRISVQLH